MHELAESVHADGWQNAHVDMRNGRADYIHLINVELDENFEPHNTANVVLERTDVGWRKVNEDA